MGVGEGETVGLGDGVPLGVGLGEGLPVGVGLGLGVSLGSGDGSSVGVGVGSSVGSGSGVSVGPGEIVSVGVGSGRGILSPQAPSNDRTDTKPTRLMYFIHNHCFKIKKDCKQSAILRRTRVRTHPRASSLILRRDFVLSKEVSAALRS